ncbi:cysteine proteinase inhibitor 12-like [Papaver somniferum]|uniref:cysteine proteinase inhibitor 12-like n=1 Tax=Papaver somniferum TaxID=3469 RepID=UPI000E6FAC62|nr:cysteine proteinase inhibitor 12-like [Papaver somniferum]
MAMVGNVSDSSKGSQISLGLAKFVVDEHNKIENAVLEFVRIGKAKEQVVSGAVHHLTLEVIEAGKKKFKEAKVWVKPWMDFKELQEFKHCDYKSSSACNSTPSDLGFKREEGHAPGLKAVPADDPAVKDAADHAVESINQRSNSLTPHELLEILVAKAEVIEDAVKFHILLTVKWGSQEEKYKVEVHKDVEGRLLVKVLTFH